MDVKLTSKVLTSHKRSDIRHVRKFLIGHEELNIKYVDEVLIGYEILDIRYEKWSFNRSKRIGCSIIVKF